MLFLEGMPEGVEVIESEGELGCRRKLVYALDVITHAVKSEECVESSVDGKGRRQECERWSLHLAVQRIAGCQPLLMNSSSSVGLPLR